jgi:Fe2+ transport system protein FeoA
MALLNMGVMPGDVLELTDRILGGCPIAFRVRSTKIALRRNHAESVEVELVAPAR